MNNSKWRELEDAPLAIRTYYEAFVSELEKVQRIQEQGPLEQASAAWKLSRTAMAWLRQYLVEHPLRNEQEEIRFFKRIKPVFQQEYLYWMNVFEAWLHLPIGNEKSIKKYVHQQLEVLAHTQQLHTPFFQYLRLGQSDRDGIYFTRQSKSEEELLDPLVTERDRAWSTGYDLLVARFLATERLVVFWHHMEETAGFFPSNSHDEKVHYPLRWTASKAALVELIYALQTSGVYNNGQVELKQLVALFSQYFQVDLGNFYHVFNEIRLRKKNRTQLLDLLKEKVVAKMDELDIR